MSVSTFDPPQPIADLLSALYEYDRAATKFLDKCENGGAFSKETRRELTIALEKSRAAAGRAFAFCETARVLIENQ